MKEYKIPMRKDILSNKMMPKRKMIRIVRTVDNSIVIDDSGKLPGRGAYVSLNPSLLKKSMKHSLLDKALNIQIKSDFYNKLLKYMIHKKERVELFKNKNNYIYK